VKNYKRSLNSSNVSSACFKIVFNVLGAKVSLLVGITTLKYLLFYAEDEYGFQFDDENKILISMRIEINFLEEIRGSLVIYILTSTLNCPISFSSGIFLFSFFKPSK